MVRTRIEAIKVKERQKVRGFGKRGREIYLRRKTEKRERNIKCNTTGIKVKASHSYLSICNTKDSILMVKKICCLCFSL